MRALVTGASGFIGRHLVRRLLKEKYKVRCLVRKNSNVNGLIDVELVYGDLLYMVCQEKLFTM
ncbi:NAD-dependent epimerase/dehydratase family protein [Candidatus Woesearchaeota archaeon]|nr:NAD-dependent epimerase/dehydratase family protein [Candidatus Woesearchaeota archaeon]